MKNITQLKDDEKTPKEMPAREDPRKVKPEKALDLRPDKSNPVNPRDDEDINKNEEPEVKRPIQENPGNQITG